MTTIHEYPPFDDYAAEAADLFLTDIWIGDTIIYPSDTVRLHFEARDKHSGKQVHSQIVVELDEDGISGNAAVQLAQLAELLKELADGS